MKKPVEYSGTFQELAREIHANTERIAALEERLEGPGEEAGTGSEDAPDILEALTVPELAERLTDRGVALDELEGSGADGNVVKRDLVEALRAAEDAAGPEDGDEEGDEEEDGGGG